MDNEKTNETVDTEVTTDDGKVENEGADVEKKTIDYVDYEKLKKEKSGVDKSYNELKKEMDKLRKQIENAELEKMNELDKFKTLYENEKKERELKDKELSIRDINDKKRELLRKNGLSEALYKVINGNDDEIIEDSIKTLLNEINEREKIKNAERLSENKQDPKAAVGKHDINTEYMEAFKKGDVSTMERIKAEVNKGTS